MAVYQPAVADTDGEVDAGNVSIQSSEPHGMLTAAIATLREHC